MHVWLQMKIVGDCRIYWTRWPFKGKVPCHGKVNWKTQILFPGKLVVGFCLHCAEFQWIMLTCQNHVGTIHFPLMCLINGTYLQIYSSFCYKLRFHNLDLIRWAHSFLSGLYFSCTHMFLDSLSLALHQSAVSVCLVSHPSSLCFEPSSLCCCWILKYQQRNFKPASCFFLLQGRWD